MAKWEAIASKYDPLKAGSIDGTDEYPHDSGIFRAINAKYKQNKGVVGEADNTVFVGRLSPHTDEDALEKHFSKYGEIKRLRLIRDIVTGISRCYAFVEFQDSKAAYRTQKHLDKTILDEKEIYVDFECERTLPGWRPRRLGGGIGGQKESGQLRFGGKNRPFRKPFNIDSVMKPEGDTFRERYRQMGENPRDSRGTGERGRYERNRHSDRSRDYDDRDRGRRQRSRSRSRRSRSRDRSHNRPRN